MSANRTMRVLLLAFLVPVAGACVPVHNLLADRELVCEGTPDDLCLRVAELALPRLDLDDPDRNIGPVPKVSVIALPQQQCWRPNLPDARRCWMVEAAIEGGVLGIGVVERGDGSLVID